MVLVTKNRSERLVLGVQNKFRPHRRGVIGGGVYLKFYEGSGGPCRCGGYSSSPSSEKMSKQILKRLLSK